MKKIFIILIPVLCIGCSAKITTNVTKGHNALAHDAEVIVLSLEEDIPPSAIDIGTVKIGDTGFTTNCGWNVIIEKAKMEARKSGGNVLKITEHIPPSTFGSSCDRIVAKILKIENPDELVKLKENEIVPIDSTWNYAKLFVYRPGGVGALVGYDLHLGDTVICRVKNNWREEITITKKGSYALWAQTESKVEIPIEIEFGRIYYIRCGVGMGAFVGRPQLQLVDLTQGKIGYNSVKRK
ncbi:MAG TPA: hypothetical protein PLJ60_20515 [Chryseolinea sp.]|nr:hypothetical protein [Chryseolinea sp.]HPM32729.1 hypothetical protein [Chryseolinea sp.]